MTDFPGGNLGVFTLLLLQIGLLNHVDLQGSRGTVSRSSPPQFPPPATGGSGKSAGQGRCCRTGRPVERQKRRLLVAETTPGPAGRRGPAVAGGRLGARWDTAVSLPALTSSCGRRLMRIRSAFSLSCLLSMRAKRSLEALSWGGAALAEGTCPLPPLRLRSGRNRAVPRPAVTPPC